MVTFAPPRVPPLALVPRGGGAEKPIAEYVKSKQTASSGSRPPGQRAKAKVQSHVEDDVERVADVQSAIDSSAHEGADRAVIGQEDEERLGERFLRAMALLARLSRTPLDGQDDGEDRTSKRRTSARSPGISRDRDGIATQQDATVALVVSPPLKQQQSQYPGKAAASPPKAGTGGSPMRPHLVTVNAATAPLHEHLTFEISMLLPPPIDSRQRSLQSPIRRERLRKRRRRRRRKKRLRREWHTSHTTWVPHMASDYAESQEASAWRRNQEFQLSQQMQQLDLRRSRATSVTRSISLPLLDRKQDHALANQHCHDDESSSDSRGDETGDDGEEDDGEKDDGGENDNDGAGSGDDADTLDANDSGQPSIASPSTDTQLPSGSQDMETITSEEAAQGGNTPAAAQTQINCNALRHHRPAWISPELRAWLIDSGLFVTTTAAKAHSKHSLVT